MGVALAPQPGPASNVLAVVDGSDENRDAAIAGADLFASTPGLTFTVLAPTSVAQPSGEPRPDAAQAGSNGSAALLQRSPATSCLMDTVREIEDRGLDTCMRTVDGSVSEHAVEAARAHDLVVLPPSMADEADAFPVPTLVAP